MTPDTDPSFIKVTKAIEQLIEDWDSIHIFCTRHEPTQEGGTGGFNYGIGNWYAREGQIREWIQIQDERARIKARMDQKEGGE